MPYQSPAILGATPLGGELATLFANAGLRVRLYDKPQSPDPNALGRGLINRLLSEYPSAALSVEASHLIDVRNYRDHHHLLQSHDLVVDCTEDNLEQKQGLWIRLAPVLAKQATLITHLDTLALHDVASVLPAGRRVHLFGAHFSLHHEHQRFVELMQHPRSESRLQAPLTQYLQSALDLKSLWIPETPNHALSRLALFLILSAYHHGATHALTLYEIEALTGAPLSRSYYGIGYLADCMGLARLKALYHHTAALEAPHFLAQMPYPKRFEALVAAQQVGKASGRGVYDHRQYPAQPTDTAPFPPPLHEPTLKALKTHDFKALCQLEHRHAQFVRAYLLNSYQYAMVLCQSLGIDGASLDEAMCQAWGWSMGLHEQYQAFGASQVLASSETLPYPISRYWHAVRMRKNTAPKALCEVEPPPHQQLIKSYPHSHSYTFSKNLTLWQPKNPNATLNLAELNELLDTLHHARHNQSALLIYHHGNRLGAPFPPKSYQPQHHQLLNQVVMALRLHPFPVYLSASGQLFDFGYALMMQVDQALCAYDGELCLSAVASHLPSVGGVWLEWLRRLPSIDEDNHLTQIHAVLKYLLQNPSHSIASARNVGILRASDTIVHHRNQLREATENAMQMWSQSPMPRLLRYGRASLNAQQLERLKALADKTINPTLYREMLSLLALQHHNHSLSLSTLLGHELAYHTQHHRPHKEHHVI